MAHACGSAVKRLDEPARPDKEDDSHQCQEDHVVSTPPSHTARSLRSGRLAPRFCPTSVAAALLMPHDGRW